MVYDLSDFTGTKWEIFKQISKGYKTPKEIAQKINSTLANVSQQLKLLEAYGYLKKERVDKGPGGRKKQDKRIAYSISKEQNLLVSLSENVTGIKQIKDAPVNHIFLNCVQNDIQEYMPYLMKLYCESDFSDVHSLFYIEESGEEIHLLVITDQIKKYRENSKIVVDVQNKKKKVSFWSHTPKEFSEGLERKEGYFLDKEKKALLVLGKPIKEVLEGKI